MNLYQFNQKDYIKNLLTLKNYAQITDKSTKFLFSSANSVIILFSHSEVLSQ